MASQPIRVLEALTAIVSPGECFGGWSSMAKMQVMGMLVSPALAAIVEEL
jgi:hypothetical protein